MVLSYCYPDNEVKRPFNPRTAVPYHSQDATKFWILHFSNSLYLTFLAKNEVGFLERQRATKELGVAQTKLEYWQRHPNWDRQSAERQASELRKQWEGKRYNG